MAQNLIELEDVEGEWKIIMVSVLICAKDVCGVERLSGNKVFEMGRERMW